MKSKKEDLKFQEGQTVYSPIFGEGIIRSVRDISPKEPHTFFVVFDNAQHQATLWYNARGKRYEADTYTTDYIQATPIAYSPTKQSMFKIGDKVISVIYGAGTVSHMDNSTFPIKVTFSDNCDVWFTADGRLKPSQKPDLCIAPIEVVPQTHIMNGWPHAQTITCDLSKINPNIPNRLCCPNCSTAISIDFIGQCQEQNNETASCQKQEMLFMMSDMSLEIQSQNTKLLNAINKQMDEHREQISKIYKKYIVLIEGASKKC